MSLQCSEFYNIDFEHICIRMFGKSLIWLVNTSFSNSQFFGFSKFLWNRVISRYFWERKG